MAVVVVVSHNRPRKGNPTHAKKNTAGADVDVGCNYEGRRVGDRYVH